MLLTLFCDASFDSPTGAAGWGAWAKRDDWNAGIMLGDRFKTPLKNNSDAELGAIVNALACLNKAEALKAVDTVMIQSDSHRALLAIVRLVPETKISNHADGAALTYGKGLQKVTSLESAAVKFLTDLKWEAKVKLIARHVRGHRPGDKRQWVNRQCDAEARKHMQAMRAGLKAKEKV